MTSKRAAAVSLGLFGLIASLGVVWLARYPFRSPEAAALDRYLRYDESLATEPQHKQLPRLVVNVPPDKRTLLPALPRDLRYWTAEIVLLRDTTRYARSIVPAESLPAIGGVWDIRPGRDPFPHEPHVAGAVFAVDLEGCRGWPCHGGGTVAVVSVLGRYRAKMLLSTWVE